MLMVLVGHCWNFGGKWRLNLPFADTRFDVAAIVGPNLGNRGVNLFLVLSGFCLYWPLVRAGARRDPTLMEFARRRCRRILPPYYVAVVIYGGIELIRSLQHRSRFSTDETVRWLLTHLGMIHNLHPLYVISIDGSLWTLALEFQLYLLFPLLVEAFRRCKPRRVLFVLLLATSVYRLWLVRGGYLSQYEYEYVLAASIFGRCFEFALGMFTAALVSRWQEADRAPWRRSDIAVALLFGVLALVDCRANVLPALIDAAYGLLFASVLIGASREGSWLNRRLSDRWLSRLGVISYSVYLIHLPLVMSCGTFVIKYRLSNATEIVIMLAVVAPAMILLGYLYHLMFERPFMNLPRSASGVTRDVSHVTST